MVVCGGLWWFAVVCGGLWWIAVVCLLVIPAETLFRNRLFVGDIISGQQHCHQYQILRLECFVTFSGIKIISQANCSHKWTITGRVQRLL